MKDGFTLLELLVVIALLGLVIAAVLVGMNGAKRKAYDTKALACSHDIHTAQEQARTADQTFRPYAALGTIRSCEALTPEGGATTDHFLYAVKHPKGQVTYTVTDSDTYIGGTARSGALLTADPAAVLASTGGGSGGAGGGSTGDPATDACIAFIGDGEGRYIDGPPEGPITDYWIEGRQRILAGRIFPVPGGYITDILNPYAPPGSMAVMVVTDDAQLTAQWIGTLDNGTFTDYYNEVSGAPRDIITSYHASHGTAPSTPAQAAAFVRAAFTWDGTDADRCKRR